MHTFTYMSVVHLGHFLWGFAWILEQSNCFWAHYLALSPWSRETWRHRKVGKVREGLQSEEYRAFIGKIEGENGEAL